jgi:hypothetical protein
MDELRLALYGTGFVLCVALVARLAQLSHPLARMLAAVMSIWAVNCAVLAALLAVTMVGTMPPWGGVAFTANAVLLVAGPLALLAWLGRQAR